jgi:hypothetical protein
VRLDEAPFDTLCALVDGRASGEFISASSSAEVHVYLQRGRVAWATDSEHPFAFTRYLQTSAGIDADGFRDILESCKRERRPLGETLVAWGLVTRQEIRAALRHQLELALAHLRDGSAAQTLFLDRTRQFAHYDDALTFALADILSTSTARSAPPSSRRGSRLLHAGTGAPPSARRLLESGVDILWTELFDGTTRVESEPEPATTPRFAPQVVEQTLLDGAELVIVWLPDGLLGGVSLSASRSLWCRLARDSTVGAAASALGAFGPASASPGESSEASPNGEPWTLCGEGDPALEEMRAFLDRAPEMLAAFVLNAQGGGRPCGVGRASLALDAALETASRRARVLTIERIFEDGVVRDADDGGVGFHFRSMVTAEPRVWCFGAELAAPSRRTVWALLDRRCSQGLGWAYLTSLSRSLLRVGTGGRRG